MIRRTNFAGWAASFVVGACLFPACGTPVPTSSDLSIANTQLPITAGMPTSGDLGVVGISGSGTILCTGVVIAPQLVLTAAHCLVGAGERAVWVGTSTATGTSFGVERLWRHPDFVDGEPAHDIGIIYVSRPMGVVAVALSTTRLADVDIGQKVRGVGFGRTSAGDETVAVKRTGDMTVSAVEPTSFRVIGPPSQPCLGDSGGPIFASTPAGEQVIGVVSNGDDRCRAGADVARVDTALEDFIVPILTRADTTRGELGEPCLSDRSCVSGVCAGFNAAADYTICSKRCANDDSCPTGWRCLASATGPKACAMDPVWGALGANCRFDIDCLSGFCTTSAKGPQNSPQKTCAQLCFTTDKQPCPGQFACERTPSGVTACFAKPAEPIAMGGGCSVPSQHTTHEESSNSVLLFLCTVATLGIHNRTRRGRRRLR